MKLSFTEKKEFLERFKDRDEDKLIELNARLKWNRKFEKAELIDFILFTRKLEISGLKKLLKEYKNSNQLAEQYFVSSMLDQKSSVITPKEQVAKEGISPVNQICKSTVNSSKKLYKAVSGNLKNKIKEAIKPKNSSDSSASKNSQDASRIWFRKKHFELIVWTEEDQSIRSFQLCYDMEDNERALTWRKKIGYTHERVDDGEGRPMRAKMSPLFCPDGAFDKVRVGKMFKDSSSGIPTEIVEFVYEKIVSYV